MFVGTLVHELLQECLRIKADTTAAINERLEHIMRQKTFLTDMLRLEISSAELRKEVEPFLPHILYFIDRYVTKKTLSSPPEAAFSNSQRPGPAPSVWAGSVKEVVDIEENIWSPRLGMKGKVDLTVRVEMSNAAAASKTLPLELKTGRASGSAEHRGQVIMYSMMMSERRQDPEAGLLLYLRNSSLQEVKAGIHEVRGLVQLRNEAARYLTSKTAEDLEGIYAEPDLPAPIEAKRICAGCTHLVACSMYQKIKVDVSLQAPHAMSELVPEALGHLSEAHEDFFEKWSLMSSLESQKAAGASRLKNLWCKTPSQREVEGTAIFGLKLPHSRTAAPQDNKNVHVFHRASVRNIPAGFQSGETVILSSDRELALSQGVLLEASDDKIVVALDRDLYALAEEFVTGRTYHIDQYQYQGAGSSNMVNLAKLMSNNPRAAKLRRLIVDKEPVTFLKGLSKDVVPVGRHILKSLNKVQQKAAFKTLMAEEYVLLRGLPGTGKTTLIVALVRLLVAMGKSVLLSAYTHSAVDNILLKLAEHADANFLRLGRKSRIHPELKKFSADSIDKGDVDALREAYASFPVIATTCLGLGDPAVTSRTFDYCILDEAGQALLLSAIGPLFHADKFVLVGDPAQLPPVVQSDAARRFGLDVSLFSHLESDDNVIPLNIQYRMNTEIMGCANRLVYNGQLECGSDEVANRCLQISNAFPLPKFDFMAKIFSVAMQDSIVFLDTSHLEQSSTESDTEEGVIKSSLEAGFVLQIVTVLRHASPSSSLGVMAPYRAQVGLLRRTLNLGPAEVNTVDQFQGRDRDVVIYSCTRSTDTEKKNNTDRRDILNDMRRLNVAITRAKSKLVFIGCKKTLLSGYDTFRKLFGLLDERVHHVLTTDDINKD
jgi:DNA replication ATP-dependent helicase Dna2